MYLSMKKPILDVLFIPFIKAKIVFKTQNLIHQSIHVETIISLYFQDQRNV